MAVPFVDLARVHRPFKDDILQLVEEQLGENQMVLGNAVGGFEKNFAREIGVGNSIAVSSGTDAMGLILHSIGVVPGDEIICPAFGPFSIAEAILRIGASVVFVDVLDDYNIDPEAARNAITEKTKVIIAVHQFGLAADVETLIDHVRDTVAEKQGVTLVPEVHIVGDADGGPQA